MFFLTMMADLNWRSGSCNGTILKMDEACFHVLSRGQSPITLFNQSEECYMCRFLKWAEIPAEGNVSLVVETVFPVKLYYWNDNREWCHTTYRFEEHGQYWWNISDGGECSSIEVLEKPANAYFPILYAFIVYFLLATFWNLGKCALNSEWMAHLRERGMPFSELESDLGSPSPTDGPTLVRSEMLPAVRRQKTRVVSLDVFRGIAITLMIFVNYGGGQYWFFKHSVWNGLTLADLVFPWFLWIMGVSLVISLRSQLRSSLRRRHLFLRVLRRSALLIMLGVVVNSVGGKNTDLFSMRLPGVLQRIGLSYLVVGTLETVLIKPQGSFQYGRWLVMQDMLDSWLQWLVVIALTATHVAITFLLPVPNCPPGYLGPGGLHGSLTQGVRYANCTGGAAGYIDRMVFGEKHLYQRPTFKEIYHTTQRYDPEGLLGTLTSVLLVYLGVQAGRVMLCYHYTFSRVIRWSGWAAVTGITAGILCKFSTENGWIPVNKNLWSLSYVLALASMAFILQSILYLVIDVRRWWSGAPFQYVGMNSILLYVGHELTRHMFPWSWKPLYSNHGELLAMNLWGTTLWLFIAYVLFCKNVFLTI